MDRTGFARGTLAVREGAAAGAGARQGEWLTMGDMMGSMNHGVMGHGASSAAAMDHGAMNHGAMTTVRCPWITAMTICPAWLG
jgi:hypothetical protein